MKITYYCIYCNTELSLSPLKGHIGALYCEKCLRFYPISKNIVDVPEILPDFYRDLTDDKRWLIDNQIDVPLQIIEHEIKMEHLNKRMKFIVNAIKDAMIPYDISGEEYPSLYEKEYLNFFLAQIKEASMILDLACGNGRHLPDLCKNADYVVGLDLSVSNLKRAKVVASKFNNIELVRSDILNLPFKSEFFDGIWFCQAFEYVPPDFRRKILSQLYKILKPGGIVFMSVETWQDPSIITTMKELFGDLKYFLLWKVIKRKPLLWGEFLYPVRIDDKLSIWHYHVHTSKRALLKLLRELNFQIVKLKIGDGYIHVICKK